MKRNETKGQIKSGTRKGGQFACVAYKKYSPAGTVVPDIQLSYFSISECLQSTTYALKLANQSSQNLSTPLPSIQLPTQLLVIYQKAKTRVISWN
jgi:hypothetical protein